MAEDMSKFHDDLLAKAKTLTESARKAAAAQTELQQSFTDVSRELDEATKLLEDMLKDDASQGSSTGGEPAPQASGTIQPTPENQGQNQGQETQQPTQKLREKDGGQWSAR
jgi:hypothetical protein